MSLSTASASISGNSVVPGLPNITSTPSCFKISRNARFPEMTGKASSADDVSAGVWLFAQEIFVLAGEHELAVLIMDGDADHDEASRALRDQLRDGEGRIECVARIDG